MEGAEGRARQGSGHPGREERSKRSRSKSEKKKTDLSQHHSHHPRAGPLRLARSRSKQPHRARATPQTALTFSSMKLRQPSLGTNAAIFLPFLISCTRAHLRMAELGCLASMPL